MLVRDKAVLSPEFRAWLRDLMTQKGYSVNALALAADLHQSTFNSGLLGNRNIPNETLAKIAPHLGVSPERITTLADLDRIGGIERIKKHAPEVLDVPVEPTRPLTFEERLAQNKAEREAKRIANLPDEHYGTVAASWDANPKHREEFIDEDDRRRDAEDNGDGDFSEDT